ncbi:hypothetical protein [Anaerovorax sp. IOR16]|uniref:hypothetical protein n=1 Tax=Anaerovorax sp. IOR16 TaxID=2773458 RepID=UPI0019D28C83
MEVKKYEYDKIHTTAKSLLNKNNYDEKGISALDKIKTYLMINIQTLTDKTPSHIAEMLMIGSNMGVIDVMRVFRAYLKGAGLKIQPLSYSV